MNAEDGKANEHLHEVKLDILCNRECHRIFKSAKMLGGERFDFVTGGILVTERVGLRERMRRSGSTCCVQVKFVS